MKKDYIKYAEYIVNGRNTACNLIKLACQRFLDDLKRDDLIFDEDAVDRVIQFTKLFKHTTGTFAGQEFVLSDWQQFIVANIYGFYWKESGLRRFTSAYLQVARKNGKTALAAILGLYSLVGEGEAGAQVICAANSREQAKILLQSATDFVKTVDPKKKFLSPYRYEIKYPRANALLKIVSSDTRKLDGLNCSTFIIDEYHEAKDTRMWDVLRSSQGMRTNPLGIIITTAGFNKTSPCYERMQLASEILNGLKEDDSFFAAIYTLDVDDDWTLERNWKKASPNLDVTVSRKFMKDQIKSAIINPSEQVGVKTKLLDIWCDSMTIWIPEDEINKYSTSVNLEEFADCDCYVGVDLSATSDLTAVSYLVQKDGIFYFKIHYYLPEVALETKPDKELYKEWVRRGQITITPGNVTDYDYITNEMVAISNIVNIKFIAYDPWNAISWAVDCTEQGLPLKQFGQNMANFNNPTREFERLLLSGFIRIDNNEITRFCFRNVNLKADLNGNTKPVKTDKLKKIDGVIATLEALGIYLSEVHYSNEIITF